MRTADRGLSPTEASTRGWSWTDSGTTDSWDCRIDEMRHTSTPAPGPRIRRIPRISFSCLDGGRGGLYIIACSVFVAPVRVPPRDAARRDVTAPPMCHDARNGIRASVDDGSSRQTAI
jgi:hypothetical protein